MSCLSDFTWAKVGGLTGGVIISSAALGYVSDLGSFGNRFAYVSGGVLAGSLLGYVAGETILSWLPQQARDAPGVALSAGGGVVLAWAGLAPGYRNFTNLALVGAGSAGAYYAGCSIAGMIDKKLHV